MSYLILLTIFLISQDIFLFNEETLILICFIIFCFIFFESVNKSTIDYFQSQSFNIEQNFITSYTQLILSLNKKSKWNNKKNTLKEYFKSTKIYYLNLNYDVVKKLIYLQRINKQSKLGYKLQFLYELEQQFTKLIIILILLKVKKLVKINLFYKNILKISNFICMHKIIFQEYIKIIN